MNRSMCNSAGPLSSQTAFFLFRWESIRSLDVVILTPVSLHVPLVSKTGANHVKQTGGEEEGGEGGNKEKREQVKKKFTEKKNIVTFC